MVRRRAMDSDKFAHRMQDVGGEMRNFYVEIPHLRILRWPNLRAQLIDAKSAGEGVRMSATTAINYRGCLSAYFFLGLWVRFYIKIYVRNNGATHACQRALARCRAQLRNKRFAHVVRKIISSSRTHRWRVRGSLRVPNLDSVTF